MRPFSFAPRPASVAAADRGGSAMDRTLQETLVAAIRSIPDYPKPGIVFRDITTMLGDARAFRRHPQRRDDGGGGNRVDRPQRRQHAPFDALEFA